MFDWAKAGWSKKGCDRYTARLEDYLGNTAASPDSELEAHLQTCPQCRQALDDAMLARELLRQPEAPVLLRSDRLVVRVMASIQEELSRRASEGFWKPLELLASRFALVAAMVLLLLGAYLVKSMPQLAPPVGASQTAMGAMIPDSPQPPSSPDEIVMSLAEAGEQ